MINDEEEETGKRTEDRGNRGKGRGLRVEETLLVFSSPLVPRPSKGALSACLSFGQPQKEVVTS